MSSTRMLNSFARAVMAARTALLTASRCVSNCSALYCATTDFKTSLPMDGRTRSSQSGPSDLKMVARWEVSGLERTRREMLTIWRSKRGGRGRGEKKRE